MTKKTAKELAQETMQVVKDMTDSVTDSAVKAAEMVTAAVNETIEKNPEVAEAVKGAKETIEKAAKETKKAARKTVKKATDTAKRVTDPQVTTYIQYLGKEICENDIKNMVVENYIAEGHKKSEIKEIDLYIKPEDNAAYYVVNGTDTGKVYL